MRPLESIYQDELYRSCYGILGSRCFLISEWSAGTEGRIDFYVDGGVNWGIECLREGINIDEHLSRFRPNGRYHGWIEDRKLVDYVVLDFRKTTPTLWKSSSFIGNVLPLYIGTDSWVIDVPFLFHIIFNNDYTECQIFRSDGVETTNPFRLLN